MCVPVFAARVLRVCVNMLGACGCGQCVRRHGACSYVNFCRRGGFDHLFGNCSHSPLYMYLCTSTCVRVPVYVPLCTCQAALVLFLYNCLSCTLCCVWLLCWLPVPLVWWQSVGAGVVWWAMRGCLQATREGASAHNAGLPLAYQASLRVCVCE